MSAKKRYCVFGCDDLDAAMHTFPHPERKPELFKCWLSIVKDKLNETDPCKIFNNKRVCDHHFTPDQKVTGHRLIYMAVPTVNFDGVFLTPYVQTQLEHNYCLPNMGNTASHSVSQASSSGVVPCAEKDVTLHCFPNPCDVTKPEELERFRTWVMRIGGDILGKDNKFIHRNKYVCHRHFEDVVVYSTKTLSRMAIPTLHIPVRDTLSDHSCYKDQDDGEDMTESTLGIGWSDV